MPLNNSFHAPWLPVRTLFNFLISGRHFSWRSEAIFRVHQLKKKREFLLSFPALFMALKSLYYWRHINSTNLNCSGKKNVSVPLFNWFRLKKKLLMVTVSKQFTLLGFISQTFISRQNPNLKLISFCMDFQNSFCVLRNKYSNKIFATYVHSKFLLA